MLLQAFSKAVPQKRLSDAFRSSMRELNELLNPTTANTPSEAPRVGKLVKDMFRGIAQTTGLAVKPTPPPALPAEDDVAPLSSSPKSASPPLQQVSQPVLSPFGLPPEAPLRTQPAAAPYPQTPLGASSAPPPSFSAPRPFEGSPLGDSSSWQSQSTPLLGQVGAMADAGSPTEQGDGEGEMNRPQGPIPFEDSLQNDPLLNAGKAVWGFGKSLLSAVKGDKPEAKSSPQKQENSFYYDKEKGLWRQRGVESQPDPSEYDPMTGKKLLPKVTEPPPPPPPSSFGPPPSGGTGPCAAGAGRGSLYVNPGYLSASAEQLRPGSSPKASSSFGGFPPMGGFGSSPNFQGALTPHAASTGPGGLSPMPPGGPPPLGGSPPAGASPGGFDALSPMAFGNLAPPPSLREPFATPLPSGSGFQPLGASPYGQMHEAGSPTHHGAGEGPRGPSPMDDSMQSDPLLSAGKAVWGFGKSIVSAVKGEKSEAKSSPPKQDNSFYYDTDRGLWRQRGVDNLPDPSEYDPMTGKKLLPKVTEPPPPPPPANFGPPPSGPGGMPSGLGGAGRGSLYVNPGYLGGDHRAPVQWQRSSPQASGSFGGFPPMGGHGGSGQAPAGPYGAPPAMEQSPFGAPLGGLQPPLGAPPNARGPPGPAGGGGPLSSPFGQVRTGGPFA